MPAATVTAQLAEAVREVEAIEYIRQAALRERLVDVLIRARGLADEIEELLDDPLVGGDRLSGV